MTTIYLSGPGHSNLEAMRLWDWEARPLSILVSFAYIDQWRSIRAYFRNVKSTMLDSGAFTAHTIGKVIDHDALLAEMVRSEWDEAVGLDVIGSWQGSKRNAEYALAKGVTKAMPVFHIGEPWDLLAWYSARFPKVGIGGMVGTSRTERLRFLDQVFARVWPHKLHAFGVVDEDTLMRFPFHSADAATWVLAPAAYRNWLFKKRGKQVQRHLSVEGSKMSTHGIRNHMEALWRRERALVARWSSELAKLEVTT